MRTYEFTPESGCVFSITVDEKDNTKVLLRNIDKHIKRYNQGQSVENIADYHASRVFLTKLSNFFDQVCYTELKYYSGKSVEKILRKIEEINPDLFKYLKARN